MTVPSPRAFSAVDLILHKRDGDALGEEAIEWLIEAYAAGRVPDYQMSAFLMAALLRGMDLVETLALTRAMLASGSRLPAREGPAPRLDKHSTGGVGDKVSLVLAPLAAACGLEVPMISGRGLAFSGGTLDKLEAIPGFRTDLSLKEAVDQLDRIGLVMMGQTREIAPADRKVYALRDVTGTVECLPFIAASILSKKLAEGIDGLVLDVKQGRGAFMKTSEEARGLAELLVTVGEEFGLHTVAYVTAMDTPLGYGVGNWPETLDAIRCLQGERIPEIYELSVVLTAEMLVSGGMEGSIDAARRTAETALADGRALRVFERLVEAQGGDVRLVAEPGRREGFRPVAVVTAPAGVKGYVAAIDALAVGRVAMALGAGRTTKEDGVDPLAGLVLNKKPGQSVEQGEPLATLYAGSCDDPAPYAARVRAAFGFTEERPQEMPLLLGRFARGAWNEAERALA